MEQIPKRPSDEDISKAFDRYDFLVKTFEKLINALEEKNKVDQRWFIFGSKIGKKCLTHTITLHHLISHEIYFGSGKEKVRFIDQGSLFSLIRVQLECYAVFYHLLVDRCHIEERMVRFHLWQLDGMNTRQRYTRADNDPVENLEFEKAEIERIETRIKEINFFKSLPEDVQKDLIKYRIWKFTSASLQNKDKNKRKISIDKMVENTGIKNNNTFENWYSYSSTHVHTDFWSVVQCDTLTDDQKITTEYIALMMSSFILCHFMLDLSKIQQTARDFISALPLNEQDVIVSFDTRNGNPPLVKD